jgi:hypothetical protein
MYTRTFRPLTGAEREYVEGQIAANSPLAPEVAGQETRKIGKKSFLQGALFGVVIALALGGFTHVRPKNSLPLEDALRVTLLLLLITPLVFGMLNRWWTLRDHRDTQDYQAQVRAENHARWEEVLRTGTREVLYVEASRCWHYDLWPDQAYYEAYFFAVGEQETLCMLDYGMKRETASDFFELARYFPQDYWEYSVLGEEIEPERSLDAFPMPTAEKTIELVDYLAHGYIYPIALNDIEQKLVQYLKQQNSRNESKSP